MDKKWFLVLGPESSGNNLASLVLKTMGAFWEEPQKLDLFLKGNCGLKDITDNPNIVLRRSIPYGNEWFNPKISAQEKFAREGYKMHTIILQREWTANILSNYYHRENTVEDALDLLRVVEKFISGFISMNYLDPFWILNISCLMKDPKPVLKGLELFTGLKWPENIPYENIVKDADIGRHSLFLDYGFESIDRTKHKKYIITKPKPLVIRRR